MANAEDFKFWDFNVSMGDVGDFLEKHYSPQKEECPVAFYGDYLRSPITKIDTERLHSLLSPFSTYLLYFNIASDVITFRGACWHAQQAEAIALEAFRWNWRSFKADLQAQGKTEVEAMSIVKETIVEVYRLLTAYLSDLYYLTINPLYEPQLFSIVVPEEVKAFESYVASLHDVQRQLQADYYQELERLAEEAKGQWFRFEVVFVNDRGQIKR
jgi:hypothetical protein